MKNFKNFTLENTNNIIGGKGKPDFVGEGRPEFAGSGRPELDFTQNPLGNMPDLANVPEQAIENLPDLAGILPVIE